MKVNQLQRSKAQQAREAIQRIYIAMRHLFIRGSYKPLGESGRAMIEALSVLSPEIYGDLNDSERVELGGLLYVLQRLPRGIEECRFIRLISREGFENSKFSPIVAPKRRRDSYRIDEAQMFIEMTRGRSDVYDIMTHLTFLYIEAGKIRSNSLDGKDHHIRDWLMLEDIVQKEARGEEFSKEVGYTYLSTLLGRTYEEVVETDKRFQAAGSDVNSLFHIVYWLGKRSIEEFREGKSREISFSFALREKIGHHVYGEAWALNLKQFLEEQDWLDRPIHIISANRHSVMNSLYAHAILANSDSDSIEDLARRLSMENERPARRQVEQFARQNGMYQIEDDSGANITVQIFDLTAIDSSHLSPEVIWNEAYVQESRPLLLVMDYAFGEQAYEVMDELLKPYISNRKIHNLDVCSISIMGKAGILEGIKGDIMVPTAHIFEGTADNYPVDNQLKKEDFEGHDLAVYAGPMITVLGTSLQNREILRFFLMSSWQAIGLEMEGAHYQKAIQSASKIRKSIRENVALRYAYYASDNPLETGATLASGSLGMDGVKPTYLVTLKILNSIMEMGEVKKG
ncbi:MAG: hypothetical protein AAGI23_10265 [Bacteroidota bacterium]